MSAVDAPPVEMQGQLPLADGSFAAIQGIAARASGRATRVLFMGMRTLDCHAAPDPVVHRFEAVNQALAICQYGPEGTILGGNALFFHLVGHDEAAIVGKRFDALNAKVASGDGPAAFWPQFGDGQSRRFIRRHRSGDGKDVWLREVFVPTRDASGTLVSVLSYAFDVTAEQTLRVEHASKLDAMDRAFALIEFDLSGHVLDANANFLKLMGYALDDIVGQHHRIFCNKDHADSAAYRQFWQKLGQGDLDQGEYLRLRKDGSEVWIQASYNPVFGLDGQPVKIVKVAMDVTEQRLVAAEAAGKVSAIDRAQAVIEFDLDGNVLAANENFLLVMGYSLREVMGKHHSMFCSPDYIRSLEYRDFWLRLNRGEFHSGRFHRLGKYDRDVHIQATYNPVLDLAGKPVRIVKYATDVTDQVLLEKEIGTRAQEMTGLIDRLSGSIQAINEATEAAERLSRETQGNADDGRNAISGAIESIELMQKSASGIAEIVSIIGEIAGQTNLLAFNAEIEAARAGEHGVGFSVVAGEVRKLAERSSTAARDISRLIDESLTRIGEGTERSHSASAAFGGIARSAEHTGHAIEAISKSARSQDQVTRDAVELIRKLAAATRGGVGAGAA